MSNLDRVNRWLLLVLSVALISGATLGLLRSYGVFGDDAAQNPLLFSDLREFVDDSEPGFWIIAFFLSVLVAYLGWRWLRAQLVPSPSLGELPVAQTDGGRTTLTTKALAEAVSSDLEADVDVRSARVRVVGSEDAPALDVRAAVADNADPVAVRTRIESDVVGRARTALERGDLTAVVRLRLGDPTNRTVA